VYILNLLARQAIAGQIIEYYLYQLAILGPLRLPNDANLYGEYGLLGGGPYRPPLPPPLS